MIFCLVGLSVCLFTLAWMSWDMEKMRSELSRAHLRIDNLHKIVKRLLGWEDDNRKTKVMKPNKEHDYFGDE